MIEWAKRSEHFLEPDFKSLQNSLHQLDNHLTLRTHIVGHSLSIADISVWAAVRGNKKTYSLMHQTPQLKNLHRWYTYIQESNPWINDIMEDLSNFESKARAAASSAGASYEIDLPGLDEHVVTRFPPEPSGYLHIGHAKAALLNDYFAHRRLGTLICRFDDTNPSKESMEFQDSILEDLRLLNIIPDKTSYSSDYFQDMYDLALKLIHSGKAFADDSELGRGDEDRRNRLPSKRRDLNIKETLGYFDEMRKGTEEGLRWCLRARIEHDSPNGTLRDPVIYRCNLIP